MSRFRTQSSHTEFPDEEGTEIVSTVCRRYVYMYGHTEFPDEEGTEI